jgi:hypothetical protein
MSNITTSTRKNIEHPVFKEKTFSTRLHPFYIMSSREESVFWLI